MAATFKYIILFITVTILYIGSILLFPQKYAVIYDNNLGECGRVLNDQKAIIIEKEQFNWTIVEENFCTERYPRLKFLIFVLTATENFETRQIHREMYGDRFYAQYGAVTMFVLGVSTSSQLNERVLHESSKYHDIIQQDFLDTYKNLTFKGLLWLRFVVEYCPKVQYIMKTDDDIAFNLHGVVKYLHTNFDGSPYLHEQDVFICGMMQNLVPIRNPSKWCVTRNEYKDDMFRPYCMGVQYIMTPRTATRILSASIGERYFWVEDYFITGQLGHKINATYHNIEELRGNKEQFVNETALFWLLHESHILEAKQAWMKITKNYR